MKRNGGSTEQSMSYHANEVPEQTVLLTIQQVSQILGIGQTRAYALRRDGLPVIRVGRKLRVSSSRLKEWIEQHEQAY
jgi:excisionase family DNA binding protein